MFGPILSLALALPAASTGLEEPLRVRVATLELDLETALQRVASGTREERVQALGWLESKASSFGREDAVRILRALGAASTDARLRAEERGLVVGAVGRLGAAFPAGRPQREAVEAIRDAYEDGVRSFPMRLHALLAYARVFRRWKQPDEAPAREQEMPEQMLASYEKPEGASEKTAAAMALYAYLAPRASRLRSIDHALYRRAFESIVSLLEREPERYGTNETMEARAWTLLAACAFGLHSRHDPSDLHRAREALRRSEDSAPHPELRRLARDCRARLSGSLLP